MNLFLSISMAYSVISCRKFAKNTQFFLLATRFLLASTNFRQPLFVQKAFVPLCIPVFSPFMAHHNISLRFRGDGQRVKNHFSGICVSLWLQFLSACCRLNFNATDLPHTQFEPLYPKVFRGPPKVDLESIVCPPGPPKVR